MIYLIKVTYNEEETNQALPLLKIGYAGSVNRRMKDYWSMNPRVELIDTRDGGYDVERNLHLLFKEYQYIDEHSREWFHYNEEIINNFHVEIDNSPVDLNIATSSILECYPEIKFSVITEVNKARCMEEVIRILEKYIGNNFEEEDVDVFLRTYSRVEKEFEKTKQNINENPDYKKANEIIDDFIENKFSSTGIFEKKLEHFCKFMDKYGDNLCIIESLLYKIPDLRYHNYYMMFGTQGCKALGWKDADIRRSIFDHLSSDKLSSKVQGSFVIGKRYSNKELKTAIGNIYNSLGISECPKATDIKKWFNVKEVNFPDPVTKGRLRGYEIISTL